MFARKTLLALFCLVMMLAPFAGNTFAQDDCAITAINAQMLSLVSTYLATQGNVTDSTAALDLAEQLKNDIESLLEACGRAPEVVQAPTETPTEVPTEAPPVVVDTNSPFNPDNTPGTPIDPATNFENSCEVISASGGNQLAETTNAFRLSAFLPAGDYKITLLPERFQTFDPILFVNAETPDGNPVDLGFDGFCFPESAAAREYVIDFSRAGIGRQVFGHISGGSTEFTVSGSSTELSRVDIIVGGQDDTDAGPVGEFVLIIEGARLTSAVPQHVYNITLTESIIDSNNPLAAIVMGVSDSLNPALQAGVYTDSTTFQAQFTCDDAGEAACQSDARTTLEGSTVVEAAVRTVRGDDQDAAILVQPAILLDRGVQEVSYVVSQLAGTPSRDEYVIVFYGSLN